MLRCEWHWPLAHQRSVLATATPQHLSLVLWAAAALRRQDDALIRAVSARWARAGQHDAEDLSATAFALSTLRHFPDRVFRTVARTALELLADREWHHVEWFGIADGLWHFQAKT